MTLDEIAGNVSHQANISSVTINITVSTLTLAQTANFTNTSSVTILGSNSTLICTGKGVGVEFFRAGDIFIQDLAISSCGFLLVS